MNNQDLFGSAVFDADFVWGAATASFQIEGSNTADGRGESIWDRFCSISGNIADGSDGSVACGHYERMPQDVAMLKELGFDAYRFSIAWPRVIPGGTGSVNEIGLDFYDRLVDELLAAGIAPYATLYHWDLPQVLEDVGGWQNRDTAFAFVEYTRAVVGRLGDRVASWATLNEPWVSASHGYKSGYHAPGISSASAGFKAAHHLLVAHGLAMGVIRDLAPNAAAGIVLNFTPVKPATDSVEDVAQALVTDGWDNRWFVEPIAGKGYPQDTATALGWDQSEVLDGDLEIIAAPIDFLGVNYYTRQLIQGDESPVEPRLPVTDMGWEIYPEGIRETLERLHREHGFAEIYVTENGCALADVADDADFVDDQDRIAYYRAHLAQVKAAQDNGVPVRGYFAWSLLDNFEWAEGYLKRFGIVRVNYETLARVPKASALWFQQMMASDS